MDYFKRLQELLQIEKAEDRKAFQQQTESLPIQARRENGLAWYPIAIRDTEVGRGDYLTVEVERTTHTDIIHQLRFGMSAAMFSNHDPKRDRLEGTITHISGNRLKLSLRTDELPDWSRNGKLGIDALFDDNSYEEMEQALIYAPVKAQQKDANKLVEILVGERQPSYNDEAFTYDNRSLNAVQNLAVQKILSANELAIVHGPPGTGKTTTLVQAIKALVEKDKQQILVVAPSNAAVDLLTEKLNDTGLNVVRVGNPARVNEKQLSLTLDSKMAAHPQHKEIKRLKKQAREYRDMAHKYKRSFGPAEREQRKALFNEARNLSIEVERTEQYIGKDVLDRAQVITATLVGANHYTVRQRHYKTVVIDEAGQALEPACWIPILKSDKLVMAGDHCQLPPTIKSNEAAKGGLAITLMEKLVQLHPGCVTLLQEQYRMHKTIMQFSSREFYNDQLQAHHTVAEKRLLQDDQPLVFVDTAGTGYEEKIEGSGISNPEEAALLTRHLAQYISELPPTAPVNETISVGVISPYRHQVEVLKELVAAHPVLKAHAAAITVNTIDSFQGQERDVIYISLARSNSESSIGFLSEIRRMNVAMTRARNKLVIIGDSATISQFPFYADFIAYAEEAGGYVSAWEFME
ncbi:AAA domain-containing protein [Aridibaculum aurantiacum]|uniref:AAA domain-containing protein n=1 Tax=Aridibaculum aurantiacum TaxID=2810307 RepID=UPI001A973884|nr:AAA domain-containing protein [Aridibaculum aurantiacum]